ncbi:hypothetical protein HK098_008046 [Nowakowskiella sp. JEL0407]|nr:hypothetical protein HK098_008046 [Nowakowskiella sp. JEL0407]
MPDSSITSIVDDTFHILQRSLVRSVNTLSKFTVINVGKNVKSILQKEYFEGVKRRMDSSNSLVILNNLNVSTVYTQKLIQEFNTCISANFDADDIELLKIVQVGFDEFSGLVDGYVKSYIQNIFIQTIKPRIKPLLIDSLKDVRYNLSEEEYNLEFGTGINKPGKSGAVLGGGGDGDAGGSRLFLKRFSSGFEKLVDVYQNTFTESNYNQLIGYVIDQLAKDWERWIIQNLKFTPLGALRLEKDIRTITSYITTKTAYLLTREKFIKLNQICGLLNLDCVEDVFEFVGVASGLSAGGGWRLTGNEVKKVLRLRIDFGAEEVAGLKL